jgi:hypothetical protein
MSYTTAACDEKEGGRTVPIGKAVLNLNCIKQIRQ